MKPRPQNARFRVAVLASGKGSNLRALLESELLEEVVEFVGVCSDRPDAGALDLACERKLPECVVAPERGVPRDDWDQRLAVTLAQWSPDLIVLAGFMRIVGDRMLHRFPNRILNVHPSLLPSFPGKDAPAQALAARVRISGCTVHLVDRGVDTGPIIAQAAVAVNPNDTTATLHARIQLVEHRLLPAVVHAIATNRLSLDSLDSLPPGDSAITANPQTALVSPHLFTVAK